MHSVQTVSALRSHVQAWRVQGQSIVLVPTMGNLHRGHYALIERARRLGDRVVVSIFVNPTQFGPNEDFAAYPRTLERDADGLRAAGCDLIFNPSVEEVYPLGTNDVTRIEVPGLSDILCGAFRPGHFSGVATVVTKLLNMIQPDVALFGRKDYQQLLVIRRVVTDLHLPVRIEAADTVREASGLAMSSRNQYLNAAELQQAGEIQRTLQWMRDRVQAGEPLASIEQAALLRLDSAGFHTDYASIRATEDLSSPPIERRQGLIGLVAARLGKARLIDNLLI
jgi:pantoate--beta-alanine ligase